MVSPGPASSGLGDLARVTLSLCVLDCKTITIILPQCGREDSTSYHFTSELVLSCHLIHVTPYMTSAHHTPMLRRSGPHPSAWAPDTPPGSLCSSTLVFSLFFEQNVLNTFSSQDSRAGYCPRVHAAQPITSTRTCFEHHLLNVAFPDHPTENAKCLPLSLLYLPPAAHHRLIH